MSNFPKFLMTFGLSMLAFSTPSYAQATRTWVSGVGDDVNPCSRTAPCKTFAGAISKTAANGEINCLDPGGFGAVTITKSITIDCSGTMGSVLNSGTNGINVNDSATTTPNTIEVILRGLSIDGGGNVAGLNGIRFTSGRSLVLQNVFIQNENGDNGISIQPGGAAEFYAENVTVTDGNTGILIQPTGANGSIRAVLRNVRAQNNSLVGLNVSAAGNTSAAGSIVAVDKSAFTGNGTGVSTSGPNATQAAIMLNDSVVSGNNVGVRANGPVGIIRAANSVITGNNTGLSITSGGIINTYGNNRLNGNGTDGAFTAPVVPQQ
jgi:hypothetical protein